MEPVEKEIYKTSDLGPHFDPLKSQRVETIRKLVADGKTDAEIIAAHHIGYHPRVTERYETDAATLARAMERRVEALDYVDRWQVYLVEHAADPKHPMTSNIAMVVLAAALRAAEARIREMELAQAWRPIETAPRGTAVLTIAEFGPYEVAHFNTHPGIRKWVSCWDHRVIRAPTHWQPLPTPPSEAKADGRDR